MGEKGDGGFITVVLKVVDMHCDGCAIKVHRAIKNFQGVASFKGGSATNEITVVGKVDPVKLRDTIAGKTKKKVEIISSLPAQFPVVVVLKIRLDCNGCIKKIKNITYEFKGVETISFDKQKDLMTVMGTMDVEALTDYLKKKCKRDVHVVRPKIHHGYGYGCATGQANEAGPSGQPYGYVVRHVPEPQLFSDENPNACSVM